MKAGQPHTVKVLNTIKVLLLVTIFSFIFYKLLFAYHLNELIAEFPLRFGEVQLFYLLGVAILAAMNWTLESIKWKLLIDKNEPMTFAYSLKAVLSGISLSLITPNQIGDFAGRIIHLRTFDRIRGSLVTVIGHTAQVIMTAAFGSLACVWFIHDQHYIGNHKAGCLYALVSVLICVGIWLYFRIDLLSRLPIRQRFRPYLEVFTHYSAAELGTVLLLAFFRYIVFLAQFVMLLHCYNVHLGFAQSIFCIVATLCAQSFAPSFLLIDIGLRGASALWFFGFYSSNHAGILLAAYSLWIINLMLPGLAGLFFILKWRWSR